MSELAAIIEDILALHAEEDEIKESRKRAYAAAQVAKFNKTAIGLAVRAIRASRKQESPTALENQSLAEQYVAEYEAHERSRLAHVHGACAREEAA